MDDAHLDGAGRLRGRQPGEAAPRADRRRLLRAAASLAALAAVAAVAPGRARAAGDAPFTPWTGGALAEAALTDLQGRPVRLADLRGRVVVLNLWATWCEPCRTEMPSLDALRQVSVDDGIEVVGLNVGESPDRIARFASQGALELPVWRAERSVMRAWGVRMLPTTFVLDARGRVRLQVVGERDWSSAATRDTLAALRASAKAPAAPAAATTPTMSSAPTMSATPTAPTRR